MKYLIVCLIKGKAKEFNETLMYDVAKRFNVKGAIERKPPAHITLKYSFEIDKIDELENIIKEFCTSNKRTEYKLNGFGSFDKNTIFIKVEPSNEMVRSYKKLINKLKKVKWMTWKEFDNTLNFHASIAHSDVNENNFEVIWNYVTKNKPEFNLFFDNITILKMEKGIWRVHKEFLID